MNDHNAENISQQDDSRLSEQFLTSLIDSHTNFLIRFDVNGDFIFANKPFLKKLGYRKNELLGKHFSMVTVPEEQEMCLKAFHHCMNHPGKIVPLSHKKVDKTGNIIDTDWEFVSVITDDGAVVAVQGIGRDITHKLIAEKEIRQTSEKLEAFIESINDYFFFLDASWKFVRVNAAFEKISQRSREELLGKNIWEVFPELAGSAFYEAYHKAVAQNESLRFTECIEPLNMWFDASVYPSAEGLMVFLRDITEEKRAREEGSRIKNSLEALINNTEDQIWSVDNETRYVYMNKAYRDQIARLTGVEPKEGGYSHLHPGYTKDEIERWIEYYARALAGEHYSIISESTDPVTKNVLSFEISFNPIYNAKKEITGVGCFSRNITEWLETKSSIVDQNERLRHIASLTSHELRRPVASMLGLINIMDRGNFYNPDNKEVIEHLLTVGNEIDEVIRLIIDKTFTSDDTKGKYQAP